ncbi:TPA: site-specific DNA-methyltransferase [Pasteurella multocida]|nr:site-specific DNA-methyltransferase [Pasteurella multocida]
MIEFPDSDDVSPNKKTYIHKDRLDLLRSYIKIQTRKSTTHLKDLFGANITPFANPKPIELLQEFVRNTNDRKAIYLDFFAGSGTFAEAIFRQNSEDLGNRKFVLIQLDEVIEIKGTGKARKIAETAFNFVHKELGKSKPTIFDITKARIEKSAVKIQQDFPDYQGDLGFKIFETVPNFRLAQEDENLSPQMALPDSLNANLNEEQYHSLLTTWRVFDGNALTDPVQAVRLGDYFATLCGNTLYLLTAGFDSLAIKALMEKLDNDKAFLPERIVLFGANVESAKQKELKQALDSYTNRKKLNIALLVRY